MTESDRDDEASDFDPNLSSHVAPTWWALGRRLHAFHRDESPANRATAAKDWVDAVLNDGELNGPDTLAALTPERLQRFAEDVSELLERKYHGRSIGDDVIKRIRAGVLTAKEDGQFLRLHEDPDEWWAAEYAGIFDALSNDNDEPDWTTVAGICANDNCRRFFIKRRANQRYHSDLCQAAAANRRSYRKKRVETPHRAPLKSH